MGAEKSDESKSVFIGRNVQTYVGSFGWCFFSLPVFMFEWVWEGLVRCWTLCENTESGGNTKRETDNVTGASFPFHFFCSLMDLFLPISKLPARRISSLLRFFKCQDETEQNEEYLEGVLGGA